MTKKIAKSDCIVHLERVCLLLDLVCPLGKVCGLYDPTTDPEKIVQFA